MHIYTNICVLLDFKHNDKYVCVLLENLDYIQIF